MIRPDPPQYRFYNSGNSLGVIGTIPAHQDGAYTYLPSHSEGKNGPWIRTEDLHPSREAAGKAAPARFYLTEHIQANLGTNAREPLPPGAVIEYCGEHGEVVSDPGGDGRVTVRVGEYQEQWWWTFEGVTCSVVSLPTTSHAQCNSAIQEQ